jgi:hypothetical protein
MGTGMDGRCEPATVLNCGGKRSTTPLLNPRGAMKFQSTSSNRKRRSRFALPAQSKDPSIHACAATYESAAIFERGELLIVKCVSPARFGST